MLDDDDNDEASALETGLVQLTSGWYPVSTVDKDDFDDDSPRSTNEWSGEKALLPLLLQQLLVWLLVPTLPFPSRQTSSVEIASPSRESRKAAAVDS